MKLGLTVPTLAGIDAATAAVAFTIVRYAEVQAEPVADRSWPVGNSRRALAHDPSRTFGGLAFHELWRASGRF
jgi:hypothetical protein